LSEDQWWFVHNGQQGGPVAWAELHERASGMQLRQEDLVWRAGMPQWAPALSIPGLFRSVAGPPPVPPPTPAPYPPPVPGLSPVMTPSGKSRVPAALFAMLLGSFGAHKFYMGDTGLGVLYLVFFWTAIPGIIGIIEGIVYLSMSDEQFAARYR
jgi:TM2 domain-containing membrane protein YozV